MLAAPAVAVASPTPPAETGFASNATTLSGALSVAVTGHDAWVTAYVSGQLTAVDFSNPANPTVVGSTPVPSPFDPLKNSTNVTIAGSYAYVVSKNHDLNSTNNDDGTGNSLSVVDISDPSNPSVVGWVHDGVNLFGSYGVAVSGNYAYVAAQGCVAGHPCPDPSVGNSFAVVDVSNPASPTIVATLHNNALPAPWTGSNALDHATSVAISGNYAYVTAAYSNRLTVIDISDPLHPTIVASLQDNTLLHFDVDVTVQGQYAYVANQGSDPTHGIPGLAVVDISDPTSPHVVGSDTSNWLNGAYRVRAQGNMAYVAGNAAESAVAVDVSNPSHPRTAAGLYDPNNFDSANGVAVDAGGQYMFLTSSNRPTDPSGTYTGTLSVLTLDPTPIGLSVTATPPSSTNQTTATFSFSAADQVASLTCELDGGTPSPCASASSQQYSGLNPGSHTFQVTATDAAGNAAASTPYTWAVTQPPANTTAPTISGTAAQGQILAADPGSWSGYPEPVDTYQWEDCDSSGASCAAIPGATASSYTVSGSDAGHTIEVAVTATNSTGQASATSLPTAVVTGPPASKTAPTISGTATPGQALSADPGTWSGYPVPTETYQWEDCDSGGGNCVAISGATASSYTVSASDVGFRIEVAVTATNSMGNTTATSQPTAAVTQTPVSPPPPTPPPPTPPPPTPPPPTPPPPPGPPVTHGPTAAQVLLSLQRQLAPSGAASKISSLLKKPGYALTFTALESGVLHLTWYYLPKGASVRLERGRVVTGRVRRAARSPILVAGLQVTLSAAGTSRVTIRLTEAGRRLLQHANQLQLTAVGTFAAPGEDPVAALQRFKLLATKPRVLD